MNCPHCGRQVEIEDATFCPYCDKSLHLKPKPAERKESFPRIAGMLTIIGSFSALAMGLLFLFGAGLLRAEVVEEGIINRYTIPGLTGILAFAFGLVGGKNALKKQRAGLSILGMCLLFACGIVFSITLNLYWVLRNLYSFAGSVSAGSLILGVLIATAIVLTLITSIASMVLIALSKSGFS